MMKKAALIYVFFFSFISCNHREFSIQNLNGNRITVLGHGGMGIGDAYPINTYESIMKCLSLGADGTEFDVQMTKDSVLVTYHDRELSENTNLKGIINSLKWSELQNAHYTATPYLNCSIVSLEHLFSNLHDIQKYKFTFDCKLHTLNADITRFYESYINAVVNIAQKYQIENNICIESQSVEFLSLFKAKKPAYKLFIYPGTFQSGLEMALSLNLYGITISTRNITKEQIQIAHDHHLFVTIWNMHTESDNIEAIKKNPDCIIADKVKNLMKLLD